MTNLNESEIDANILVTTTTGAVQLWAQGRVQWTREESLAEIKVAEFVELPEAKTILSHIDLDGESFLTRLARQILDAKVMLCAGIEQRRSLIVLVNTGSPIIPRQFC